MQLMLLQSKKLYSKLLNHILSEMGLFTLHNCVHWTILSHTLGLNVEFSGYHCIFKNLFVYVLIAYWCIYRASHVIVDYLLDLILKNEKNLYANFYISLFTNMLNDSFIFKLFDYSRKSQFRSILDPICYGTVTPWCSKLIQSLLDTQYMQFTVYLAKLLQKIK